MSKITRGSLVRLVLDGLPEQFRVISVSPGGGTALTVGLVWFDQCGRLQRATLPADLLEPSPPQAGQQGGDAGGLAGGA